MRGPFTSLFFALTVALAFAATAGCAPGGEVEPEVSEPEVSEPEWRPTPIDREGQAAPAQLTEACRAAASSAGFPNAASPASGALALFEAAAGPSVLIAVEDHNRVWVADATTLTVRAAIALGGSPHHVVVIDDHRALVTVPELHQVVTLDLDQLQVIARFVVGAEPRGLTQWDADTAAVALAGEAAVAMVHFDTGLQSKIALPFPDPRAVSKTTAPVERELEDSAPVRRELEDSAPVRRELEDSAPVRRELEDSAPVRRELEDSAPVRRELEDSAPVRRELEDSAPVRRELEDSAPAAPDGRPHLIVGHLTQGQLSVVDVERATVVAARLEKILNPYPGGGIFRPRAGHLRSLTSTSSGRVLAVHTVAHSDPVRTLIGINDDPCSGYNACDDDEPAAVDPAWSLVTFDDAGVLKASTTPLLQPAMRQDAMAIAVLDDDEASMLTLSVHRGSNILALSCATEDAPLFAMHEAAVGAGANSLVVHADGFALVYSAFDRQLTRVHIEDAKIVVDGRAVLARPTLSPQVELGRRLFHDSRNPAMSVDGRTACASCHPGGMTDNNTWTFAFGRRNTPSLRGGILDTAPFHWPGDVADMTHISDVTVVGLMGGAGFSASDMQAIGAYLHQLPAPSSSAQARAGLTALETQGAEIFASEETACLSCHSGPHGTDNGSYDVGTSLPFEDTSAYQVPLLHGLDRTAPFLHDGRAASLEVLVDEWVRTDRMGTGSHLSDADAAALVAYLRTR